MSTRIFHQEVKVPESVDTYLRNTFAIHTALRNFVAKVLIKQPDILFKEVKALVRQYAKDNDLTVSMTSPIYNELYYQYKRFQCERTHVHKEGKNIQYIS